MTSECISNACQCRGCKCNYIHILSIQSFLTPGSVPGDTKVVSNVDGFGTIIITNATKMYISLYVHNRLENITMAHIHIKNAQNPTTQNGPIVLWLEKSMDHPISVTNDYLVSQTFSLADFIGPLKDMTMDTFLQYLQSNQLYFNIHTVKYPNGEIAGDLKLIHEWK
jgi:hypothetical protein